MHLHVHDKKKIHTLTLWNFENDVVVFLAQILFPRTKHTRSDVEKRNILLTPPNSHCGFYKRRAMRWYLWTKHNKGQSNNLNPNNIRYCKWWILQVVYDGSTLWKWCTTQTWVDLQTTIIRLDTLLFQWLLEVHHMTILYNKLFNHELF